VKLKMADCCKLVGNFNSATSFSLPLGCFISVNNNINTEFTDHQCSDLIGGATVGSLNLSGYASTQVHIGCPGRAGVQVLWLRKYDCATDTVYFIYTGQGRSFMSGEFDDFSISLNKTASTGKETRILSASSQSGPTGLISDIIQAEGIGMTYGSGPIAFNTETGSGSTLSNMGIGTGSYYLQNFNIELSPGAIPVANYTFAYNP